MPGSDIQSILTTYPALQSLYHSPSLGAYMQPMMSWRAQDVFPEGARLRALIAKEAKRLYGSVVANGLLQQMETGSYIAETGPHLHLPRDRDRANGSASPQDNINTLVVQSSLTMSAALRAHAVPFKLSLHSGIIPAANTNSAAYFQPSSDGGKLLRLVPNKLANNFLEASLPALQQDRITELQAELSALALPDKDKARGQAVLALANEQNRSFSDQICAAASYLYNELQENFSVQQLTLDHYEISLLYIIELLHNADSLLSRLFQDDASAKDFCHRFAGIATGWKEGETPFVQMKSEMLKDSGQHVYKPDGNYHGPCDRLSLLQKLQDKSISPTGLFSCYALMVEGGLLILGGMFQAGYCTQIRDRAVDMLASMGEQERAASLERMATDIAVVSPVWGIVKGENPDLLNYGALLEKIPLSPSLPAEILQVSGKSAVYGALPCLQSLARQAFDTGAWQSELPGYNLVSL